RRRARREAGDEVRAAAGAAEAAIALHASVDEDEAVRREWTARRQDGPQRGKIVLGTGHQSFLLREREPLRARAEDGEPLLRDEIPEDRSVAHDRRAIGRDHGRAER